MSCGYAAVGVTVTGVSEGLDLADVAAEFAVGPDGGGVEVRAEVVVAGGPDAGDSRSRQIHLRASLPGSCR